MKVEIVSKLKEECRSTKFLVEQVQKVTSWLMSRSQVLTDTASVIDFDESELPSEH